jgi:hypothetical protein
VAAVVGQGCSALAMPLACLDTAAAILAASEFDTIGVRRHPRRHPSRRRPDEELALYAPATRAMLRPGRPAVRRPSRRRRLRSHRGNDRAREFSDRAGNVGALVQDIAFVTGLEP